MCLVWNLIPTPSIQIFLLSIHVLRQHFAIEVGDCVEEFTDFKPGPFKPSRILPQKHLMMLISQQIELLIPIAHIPVLIEIGIGSSLVVNLKAGVLIDIIVIFDVVPSSNLTQILFVQEQGHQQDDVGQDPEEDSYVSRITRRA